MLVLTRKTSEVVELKIPPSSQATTIRVIVVDTRGDKARLGFEAPVYVAIERPDMHKGKSERACVE